MIKLWTIEIEDVTFMTCEISGSVFENNNTKLDKFILQYFKYKILYLNIYKLGKLLFFYIFRNLKRPN